MNNIEKSRDAANSYATLAERLLQEGLFKEAEFGFEAAAAIDLTDAALQSCWGGPFNGQIARQDLIEKIIQVWSPDTVIETGTFRGITTEWFAKCALVPIYSCEKNKRFFLQSCQRLANFKNIHLAMQDSRDFIRDMANTEVSKKKVLFYLDAHWEQDLPLREEISIIFQSFEYPCVIVDDFKIPFDSGYSFDDYGPGKTLSLEILDGLLSPEIQVAFPSTPSNLDTGACRGAVILMRKGSSDVIASTNMVRLADFRDWSAEERGRQINELTELVKESKYQADERMKQINELNEMFKDTKYHADERMRQINELNEMFKDAKYHADERMRQINELTDLIKNKKFKWLWFGSGK
jgi:hypothetical protein